MIDFTPLTGWVGAERPDLLRDSFNLWGGGPPQFAITGVQEDKPPIVRLFDYTRQVLGKDTENYAQQIGDCFDPSAIVDMSDGTLKRIGDVVVGDLVKTPFGNDKRVTRTIVKDYSGPLYCVSVSDRHVHCTPDHKFLVNVADSYQDSVWSSADSLSFAHKAHDVEAIKVYCLEVEDDHAFFANGIPVHNCVSFSGKNNTEYVQALPIINGALEEFKNTFPPYFYGVSRVQIGGGKIWGDGSLGSWLAAGLLKYGVLRADFNGVPAYSGSIAKAWGKSGPPSQFLEEGKLHLVNTAGQINGKQDAAAAIQNGYPCICCSNRGFKMQAGSDGFHAPSGVWGHALTLIAYSAGDPSKNIEEHFCILNSWADVHGKIKDFHDPSVEWPIGTLRVRANVVDGMIKQGDSFAVSPFQGFPAQKLPRSAFDLW